MRRYLLFLFLYILVPLDVLGAGLDIGRMRVAIWPEYDSPGVLFIYDGRFKNNELFPNETSFYIPGGSVISDACSLSPKGQHFCQLYTQRSVDGFDDVRLRLPYPNFYLSFHTDPFPEGETRRVLHHVIRANHDTDTLEVDIQKPLRAEDFRIITPQGFERYEKKGFVHFTKVFRDVKKGDTIRIELEYVKKDRRPSVNIKYSPMAEGMEMAPYQHQRNIPTAMYLMFLTGVLLLGGIVYLLVRKRA